VTEIACSAMLFDMDGVLIDSTPAVARVWHKWAVAHGFNPEIVVKMAHGRPSRETILELLPDADVDAEDLEVERREIEDLDGMVLLPGARELLNSLPAERWTIVTSATRALAEVRLKAAGLPLPKKLVTATDIQRGKPDPEPYEKAAAALGFPGSECIVIEDAPAGIHSGKAAGARVVAFQTTMERRELEDAQPDWIVGDCRDLSAQNGAGRLILHIRV